MKTITKIVLMVSGLFLSSGINAQKEVTETFKVAGNCGMCKNTIESAAMIKGVKSAIWDKSNKILVIKYDKGKTTGGKILRLVANAGYDNEMYRAPDAVYDKLHSCCQYVRETKAPAAQ